MPTLPIYMDNHATTRVDPRVLEAMLPFFSDHYGNAASRNHSFGWKAEEAVETAREQLAQVVGAAKREIVFTSGATESNNLALKGAAHMLREQGRHIITVATEHRAVLDPCRRLQSEGFHVTFLPVDSSGLVTPAQIADALTAETILVSVMAANNEIGVLQPISEIGGLCKERKILFHSDAAQAVGKVPLDVEAMGIDLLSFSAHKMYGPKGIGALYVRNRNPHVRLQPLTEGGGHERGLRSGTLPVPSIVGFGAAAQLCLAEMQSETERLTALRDRLWLGFANRLEDVQRNGHTTRRLPGNLNVSFAGVRGEALLMGLKAVAVSSGSACTSASVEPSYVLKALGLNDELSHSSIRFGLGRFNTQEEVDLVIDEMTRTVTRLRKLDPTWHKVEKSLAKNAKTV